MLNKILSMFAAMATGLLIMGLVWAGSDNDTALAQGECSTTDTPVTDSDDTVVGAGEIVIDADADLDDDSAGVSVDATVTEESSTTSTTVNDGSDDDGSDDDGSDDDGSTTTTAPAPTTTAPPATTTTSVGPDYDDSHFILDIDADVKVFSVKDAGTIKVKAVLGQLILIDVNVNAGWSYKVKKGLFDELEVVFYKTGIHLDVDVELHRHSLIVDIDAEIS
jgi:hypothetical protein